ncbi:MAG: PAS domain S-box protein [Methylobacter sp.]|nr:PAS domain S-box protein [Methylobacter sp.]
MQIMTDLFDIKDLLPHGYCLLWSPVLLWLHVISDLAITVAYYSIPVSLVYFIRQRKDFPYPWIIALFAGFIVACGTTHLLSVITIWIPLYWLDGLIKGFTAIISLATAVLMVWVIPRALSLPSAAQMQNEIEQRKKADDALRESEEKLNVILDNVDACIYIKDCNYQYRYVNRTIIQLFRKPKEDILGKKFDEIFFDEATTAELRENDRHVIELGERVSVEEIITDKDNTFIRTYLSTKQPLRREDGSIYGLCGISTDISERKEMEEKLRDNEAFNLSILNSLTAHIAVLNKEGVIVAVNNAWRQFAKENGFLEFTQDMLGINYLDACKNAFNEPYGDEANTVYTGIMAVLSGEHESFHFEYPCHSPTQQRWFHMNVSPLQASNHGVVVSHENITGRKQAERVLNQLKTMVEVSLDGFWIVDLMGNVLQANEAYAKISGYSIDELKNMRLSQLEATEGPEKIKAHIAKIIAQGHDLFETRHRHKDGHTIDIEVSIAFLPEFQQFCGFCRDITERKLLENELKASEAKFRSIIKVSPVPMALSDNRLNIDFLNRAFVQTFGYNTDDIPTLADWYLKAYPDPDYRHWVEAACSMKPVNASSGRIDVEPLEIIVCCKDNSTKTVLVTTAVIHHEFEDLHLAVLYDITRRKQIEAKLNAIFNASVEGMITMDVSYNIESANAAVEPIFGYKPEELIGCSITKLVPSLQRAMDSCNLSGAVKSADQIQEVEGIHKNGSVVPLDLSIAEFTVENAHYYTNIVRDVSMRKHQEQQEKKHLSELAHITRLGMMGEMASGIAHEVNQPLSAISSYSQVSLNLINAENPDLVKLAEIIYKTQQQALRAGRIIHRMRAFLRPQFKHNSNADMNDLIHEAVSLCIAELRQNNIRLTFELEKNLPPVRVDQLQIEQVIINLIRNSIEALQSLPVKYKRQITIHTHLTLNKGIQVRVKDNGQGFDSDQQQKILTPFYTTKTEGMGLGLSICRSLIEAYEGSLYFNSEPGKGSTFYFILPVGGKSDEPITQDL